MASYVDDDDSYEEEEQQEQPVEKPNRVKTYANLAGAAVARSAVTVAEKVEDTGDKLRRMVDRVDKWAAEGSIGRFFQFKDRRAKFSTEIRGGVVTFLMVAYVLAVNPQIIGVTGGTCDPEQLCDPEDYQYRGSSCLFDTENEAAADCLSTLRLSLTTATAATSLIATFIIGYFANLPLALAPGMGINIYVAYQVVAQDILTYEQAMVAIFLEGWVFMVLSMTGIRGGIIRLMPKNIAFASSVGIGLLLAFSGLRNLGVIVFDSNTLVTLGGCSGEHRHYVLSSAQPIDFSSSETLINITENAKIVESSQNVYACDGGEMRSAPMWLGFAGGLIMAGLSAAHVRGSLFIGVAFVTIVSWIPNTAVSFLGADSAIPGGEARMEVFKRVVAAPSLEGTGFAWDWSAIGNGHFWVVLLTFLYIDLLDCTGTLLSMATLLDDCMAKDAEEDGKLDVYESFLSDEKEFPGQQWAFLSDGIGIVAGSMMGITPVTVYIESAAGIEDGGRTGLSAITVAFFFFVALFFSPILSSIPPYATGPALILVGVMLIAHVDRIVWDDTLESIPAFLTVIIMPFTLSVAYGVIAGIVSYLLLHLPIWAWQKWTEYWAKWKKYRRRKKRRDAGEPETDGDAPSNIPPSVASSRSRRRAVHRKVFGLDGIRPSTSMGGGSVPGDLAFLEVVDPSQWGGVGSGPGGPGLARASVASYAGPVLVAPPAAGMGGGLRRSLSHGNFQRAGGISMGFTGPRNMSMNRSYHGGGTGSNVGSRNGSWGPEAVLGTSPTSMPRGPSAGALYGGPAALGRYSATSMSGMDMPAPQQGRYMSRSRTFTDIGGGSRHGGSEYYRRMSSPERRPPSGAIPTVHGSYMNTYRMASSASPMQRVLGDESYQHNNASQEELRGYGQQLGSGNLNAERSQDNLLFGGALMSLNLDNDTPEGADGEGKREQNGGDGDGGGLLFGGALLNLDLDKDDDEEEGDAAGKADGDEQEDKNEITLSGGGGGGGSSGLLFGGTLMNLDLDKDDSDEEQIQQAEAADHLTSLDSHLARSPSQLDSVTLQTAKPLSNDIEVLPSVDLESFRIGSTSRSASSPVTSPTGKSESLPKAPPLTSAMHRQPSDQQRHAEQHVHFLSSAIGSISFNQAEFGKKVDEIDISGIIRYRTDSGTEMSFTMSPAASGGGAAGSSEPAVRVEGWPQTSPPPKPSRLATSDVQQQGQQASTAAADSSSAKPGLKRVESAAAIRLRSLFQDESGEDLSSPLQSPIQSPSSSFKDLRRNTSLPSPAAMPAPIDTNPPMHPGGSLGPSPFAQSFSRSSSRKSNGQPESSGGGTRGGFLNIPSTIYSGQVHGHDEKESAGK